MAINLAAVGNQAPGFYGLNLQESSTVLDPQWASEANNAVITADGRIGARKGFTTVNTAVGDDITAGTIRTLHEYIDSSGNSDMFACADAKIFKADSPYTDFTNVYSTTITNDNWQIVNFNSKTYFFQNGEFPLEYDGTTVTKLSANGTFTDSATTAVIATVKPNCVHSAFGRLWVGGSSTPAYGATIWWSNSLAGQQWSTGSAGSIDLHTVLTGGTDYVTAISSFQDMLVIFLKNSILIYDGAETTPATQLTLREHIRGIGCIARDSVQNIGTDILFLSDTGVRSLSRVVTEDNSPIRDISKNVRDYLRVYTSGEDVKKIKSLYSPSEGFYLLSLPTFGTTFCFDIRGLLPDGAARVTTWTNMVPTAMTRLTDNSIYFGQSNNVGLYSGYGDDGVSYNFTFATPWLDYGQPHNYKILKNFYVLAEAGADSQVTMQWAVDFRETYSSLNRASTSVELAEYNVAEYYCDPTCLAASVSPAWTADSEYGYGYAINAFQGPMSKTGKVVKFKIIVPILGKFDVKKYEIYSKLGRVN